MRLPNFPGLIRQLASWAENRIKYLVFLRIQVGIALITVFLFQAAQTKEILVAIAEDNRWAKMSIISTLTFILSLLIWHTSRALSLRRKRSRPLLTKSGGRRPWIPRILGVIPIAMLLWQIWQIRLGGKWGIHWFCGTLILLVLLLVLLLLRRRYNVPFLSESTLGEGIFSKELEIFFFFSAWASFAFFAIPNSILLAKNDVNSGVIAVVATIAFLIFAQLALLSWARPQHHKYIWWGMLLALCTIAISAAIRRGKALLFWPQHIGSLSMVLMALIALLVIFSTIYRWAIYERIPVITPLLLFVFGINIFGLNENRDIRTLLSADNTENHPEFARYFNKWQQQRFRRWKACNPKQPCPIYIIAAQGGGIYAAYHAGRVLSVLNEETQGAFADHLFAISGVSGGAIGSASFLAIDNISGEFSGSDDPDQRKLRKLKTQLVSHHLRSDLLSPLLAVALYGDSLQSLLPIPISVWDRALGLELALESNFQNMGHQELTKYLDNTARDKPQPQSVIEEDIKVISNQIETFMERPLNAPSTNSDYPPALVVNTTVVENGKRFLIAPFSTNDMAHVHPSTTDQIRYSTAAVLSARFPFITTYGTTTSEKSAEKVKLVDGGYFDNSGLVTALQIRDLISQQQSDQDKNSYPVVVIALTDLNEVTSSFIGIKMYEYSRYQPRYHQRNILDQLNMTPVSALWRTRESRTKQMFANIRPNEKDKFIVLPLLKWVNIKSEGKNTKISLPLGWKLSKKSADFIDFQTPKSEEENKDTGYNKDKMFMHVKQRFSDVRNKIKADLAPIIK
jgi:hypothetical protein